MRVAIILALLIGAALVGCATTSVTDYKGPDGKTVKSVKCTSDPVKCFQQASQSCPAGGTYKVLSSESHAGGVLADLWPGPVTWYGMTYACGPSDGRRPDFAFTGSQYVAPPVIVNPMPVRPAPTTTNCNKMGNSVNCTTY